jgi:hypothetical protein
MSGSKRSHSNSLWITVPQDFLALIKNMHYGTKLVPPCLFYSFKYYKRF